MHRVLAISWVILLGSLPAFAQPTELTPTGARETFACRGTGPLGGLYVSERGGYLCVRDFGGNVEIAIPPSASEPWRRFSARLRHCGSAPELHGRAYLSGWGWRQVSTSVGLIGERMTCPFETDVQLIPLGENEMLWVYPVVTYDTACCNFHGVRYVEEHLTRVADPAPAPRPLPAE